MSFFYPYDNINEYNNTIKYEYKNKTILNKDINDFSNELNKKLIKKSIPIQGDTIEHNEPFYRVEFSNKEPNFMDTSINPPNYTSKALYFFGLLHNNISGITNKSKNFIGELVIEHTNPNTQKKVFVCFLIKLNMEQNKNNLDRFIHFITNDTKQIETNIDLNTIIPEQSRCIKYGDKESLVYIYTKPITVNNSTSLFFKKLSVNTELFNISAPLTPMYIDVSESNNETENYTNIEGFDNEIYIDCQPTGESDETIQAYSIPINSEYSNSKNQVEFFKTAMYFMVFLFITGIVNIFVPSAYKSIVIDKINKWKAVESFNNGKHHKIRDADLWISIIYFVMIISLVTFPSAYTMCGIEFNYTPIITLFLFIYYVMAFALIQNKKTLESFMTTDGEPDSAGLYTDAINNSLSFIPGGLILELISSYTRQMAAFAVSLILIVGIIAWSISLGWFWFTWLSSFISFILVPFIYLMST